jgi:hypothetical protein
MGILMTGKPDDQFHAESDADGIRPSASVRNAIEDLGDSTVSSREFFARLCELHPDYIGRTAATLASELKTGAAGQRNRKPANEWVKDVWKLFKGEGRVNTRRMMLGLALLDAGAFRLLWSRVCFPALFQELAKEEMEQARNGADDHGIQPRPGSELHEPEKKGSQSRSARLQEREHAVPPAV